MQNNRSENMQIKKMQPEHLEQYNDLLRYAFQVTEEELLKIGWEDDDILQSKFPVLKNADVLGWFDDGKLASQIAVYPMKMNVHGSVCKIGFVTGVATYPEYSGMGLMSHLMKETLAGMKERGQSIALLYPYSIPLYRHKGWEIISDKMTYLVKDFQLPKNLSVTGSVRRVPDDCPDLLHLHDAYARKTHGCLFRNDLAWEEYWRWDVDDVTTAIYYNESDEPLGYLVYLLKNEILYAKEMVCLTMEAWNGLWNFITAHESMITEVNGSNYTNTPIAFWLDDSDIKETIRPYIMGRIVDVSQFLSQYRFKNCVQDKITFHVRDPLLEWNDRPFTLHFTENGVPEIIEEISPRSVSVSIGTLTTMLMGYKRPAYLQAIGHLQADADTLLLLEQLLPVEKASISDYI